MGIKEILFGKGSREIKLPPDLLDGWKGLRKRVIEEGYPDEEDPNFIHLHWVNRDIDYQAEAIAARIAAVAFAKVEPTHVLGIANSGLSFAQAVAGNFPQAKLVTVEKYEEKPLKVPDGFKLIQAFSYSRQIMMFFGIPFLGESRVLIADDVIAHGNIGLEVCRALQEQQHVDSEGFVVYFNKDWQGGIWKIPQQLKVPCFSVLRLSGVEEGKLVLTEETDALEIIYGLTS